MIRDVLSALRPGRRSRPSPRPLPEAAAGLRPAQAGTALAGGARPSHLAATLIDLSIRGHLRIEQCGSGDDPDFLLTRGATSADRMARYERTLLRGIPRGSGCRLSQLKTAKKWVKAIGRVYHQLNREAIARGWLRPAQPEGMSSGDDPRDDRVASLRGRLRRFRQDLSGATASGARAWASQLDHLPYAVAFGLVPEWSGRFPGPPWNTADGALAFGAGSSQYALAAAFTSAACAHVQSVASHAGYGGAGGHHAGGVSHGHAGHAGHVGHGGFGGHG